MSNSNLKTYSSDKVINWYNSLTAILPVEKYVFESNKALLYEGSLLDIGIGGARTTAYLLDKCKSYIGIDYSDGFIKVSKKKYPNADIRLMNAKDLSAFETNSFDMVNFSFNGIDYVDMEGRKKILAEINRVLKPNGIFFFSTHNKNHPSFGKFPWLNKNNELIINLKTFLKLLPFLPRHIIKKRKDICLTNYAIINDSAHRYSLFTFYTTPFFLKQQLSEMNFDAITFFSKQGEKLTEQKLDDWIFVSCKKQLT